jgi:hypothetical protein
MVQFEAIRYWPDEQFVAEAVGKHSARAPTPAVENAVALVHQGGRPLPARRTGVDLREEPLEDIPGHEKAPHMEGKLSSGVPEIKVG